MNLSILKRYQIYHNYIRAHSTLDGKTPAEQAGIEIEDDNKWKPLIEMLLQIRSSFKS